MRNRMIGLISPVYLRQKYVLIENMNYCVYFITDGNYIKIGVAASLPNRMKQLQTGNPRELEALYVIEELSQKEALKDEKILHNYFSDKQTFGEWYDIKQHNIISCCNKIGLRLSKPASKFNFDVKGITVI